MTKATIRLDRTFAALADPTRRAILARLASGNASVTKLARPFDMSLPAISKHLKVLERAGLISRGRRLAGAVPAVLGPDLRPAGPISERAEAQREDACPQALAPPPRHRRPSS